MMTKSENPGSSWGFQDGIAQYKNGKIILKTDSTEYIIEHNSLMNFSKNKIKLKKE